MANLGPEDSPFPPRTSLGQRGKKMRPQTNFFELEVVNRPVLYQLDVKFSEKKLPPEKRREAFQQMQIKHPEIKIFYDGSAIGATNTKFEGGSEMMTADVTLPSGGKAITITLKIVSNLAYSDLAAFLGGKQEQTPKSLSYLNLLNIYLFHFAANDPALAAFERTRSFFMLGGERVKLQGGLELLFGGFMSVRWGGVDLNMKRSEKLFLNVDTVATTFYSKGPLLDRFRDILPRANINQKLHPNDINLADRALKKIKFMVTHRGPTWKKKYVIANISQSAASETFFEADGKKTSVAEHFLKKYQISLKFPKLPCVVVKGGPSGKMYMPIEVCVIPEGIRHRGHLTGMQTSDIIKKTATKPSERQHKIHNLIDLISTSQAKDNSWNVKISNKMTVVDARVLPEPEVQYGGKTPVRPRQGAWNTVGLTFVDPKKLDSWALIDFRNDPQTANSFVSGFVQNANSRGMSVNPKPTITTANANGNLEQILNMAVARTPNIQMFMFILPFDSGTLYPSLKRIADCNLGLPSQCLVHKKLLRANDQYYSNIALKVNHKLGGTNNNLKERLPFFDKPTMVMGADVTHPSGGSYAPSIASVVGSVSSDANLYVAKLAFQQGKKEFIEKFEDMVLHLLNMFRLRSNVLPQRIIYYRDGVGEGMFKEVKRLEIAAMLAAFERVTRKPGETGAYRPAITMVVVQKRHHARFFPTDSRDADKSQNCPAGMVVETGITHPSDFDFYLQSQAGLQGTSRPTHYHVLHDENKFTADSLQELTYRMCYLQGRSTRSVSIVPAVYHADLVCFRARSHLNDPEGWSQSSSGRGMEMNPEDLGSKISDRLEKRMWWM